MVGLAQSISKQNSLSPDEALELRELASDPAVRAAVLLKAFSVPAEVIEEVLGVPQSKTVQAMLVPSLKELYIKWSVRIKELTGEAVFNRLLPLAVHVQERLLGDESADAKVRLSVADKIVDRVRGRPVQQVSVKSMNLNVNAEAGVLDEQIQAAMERISSIEAARQKQLEAKQCK